MIYFDDLLKSDNIDYAVSRIAKDFREKYKFPEVRQLGIVVPDVEAAAAQLEEKGIGPFFIASDTLKFWNERGENRTFSGKVGMAIYKGYDVELLEPGVGSTFYKSCVDEKCRMVLQHLGFLVKDVDSYRKELENYGCSTWVRGQIKSFPIVTEFAYMDTVAQAGIIMEFIDMRFLGFAVKVPGAIYHSLGRLEKLTGIRCLSL
ncbi:MAG: VOC family protein [Deltaproteobacteria bacterium]|nr:VOC family protein [Deltaproteobacteria bacterium]